eukprot:5734871-Prymnesium_polylepis.1
MSARNDSVGIVGVPPHVCASYMCVGRAKRGQGRPIRHHGSIEVLLGARIGSDAAEASVSLDELAAASRSVPPPFFIWHTTSDELVPANNTLRLAAALAARGASVEAHIFRGPVRHGAALALSRHLRERAVSRWTTLCLQWLSRTLHYPANGSQALGLTAPSTALLQGRTQDGVATVWPW